MAVSLTACRRIRSDLADASTPVVRLLSRTVTSACLARSEFAARLLGVELLLQFLAFHLVFFHPDQTQFLVPLVGPGEIACAAVDLVDLLRAWRRASGGVGENRPLP